MKKWKLLAGLTLLLLLLLSVTAQADSSSYGVVFGAANVNLRSAPHYQFRRFRCVQQGNVDDRARIQQRLLSGGNT